MLLFIHSALAKFLLLKKDEIIADEDVLWTKCLLSSLQSSYPQCISKYRSSFHSFFGAYRILHFVLDQFFQKKRVKIVAIEKKEEINDGCIIPDMVIEEMDVFGGSNITKVDWKTGKVYYWDVYKKFSTYLSCYSPNSLLLVYLDIGLILRLFWKGDERFIIIDSYQPIYDSLYNGSWNFEKVITTPSEQKDLLSTWKLLSKL